MKKKYTNLIKTSFLTCFLLLSLCFISNLFKTKAETYYNIKDIYNLKKDSIEIMNFGNSHVYSAINTTIINDELQVDSYTYSTAAVTIELIRYQIEEMLKHQNPELITIEVSCFQENYGEKEKTAAMHKTFDYMRFNKNKINGINYNYNISDLNNGKLEYYLPLIIYHLKWKELNLKNVSFNPSDTFPYYGYIPRYNVLASDELAPITSSPESSFKQLKLPEHKVDILNEIVAICKENDTEILFVLLPYYVTETEFDAYPLRYYSAVCEYAQNNNIKILNYFTLIDELHLDYCDFNDVNHTNINGAKKISEYLANYIADSYLHLFDGSVWDYKEKSTEKFDVLSTKLRELLETQ